MKDEIINKLGTYVKEEILQQPDRELKADEPLISSGIN